MSWLLRYGNDRSSDNVTREVIEQLSEDYPPEAMGWIAKDAKWSGPKLIPTEDIDYSNSKEWRATHEHEKVHKFMKKIKKGKNKPVILIKTPENEKNIIIDGHHRSLAYRELGRSVVAYVGTTDRENGPWDEFHTKQNAVEEVDK